MQRATIPAWLRPWALRGVHLSARLLHPLTIGVRIAVIDARDRVFLVKHSYVAGWHLPGGGVEPGETVVEAAARELREEANIAIEGAPALHGIFFNRRVSRRDHVVVFVVREFSVLGPRAADWEIVDTGFFAIADLPADVAPASATRIREICDGTPGPQDW